MNIFKLTVLQTCLEKPIISNTEVSSITKSSKDGESKI